MISLLLLAAAPTDLALLDRAAEIFAGARLGGYGLLIPAAGCLAVGVANLVQSPRR